VTRCVRICEEPHRTPGPTVITIMMTGLRQPMMTASARQRRQLATLAVIIIILSVGTSPAIASPLRRLASDTVAFSSDGTRFVAWQVQGDEQIVVLDTLTGLRRQITPPAGCKLHNEAEDGEPIIGAAAGRFLLECDERAAQALLDVRTGMSVMLPKKTNGTSDWYRVGTRYVMGVNVLYDIATGASTRLDRPADLDARGASMSAICPAVRHLVLRYQPQGLFKGFADQGELFAQGDGNHGDVQLDRCHGSPTILRARGTDGFGDGEPEDFDLRGGLLSWDTGSEAAGYIPPKPKFRGGLYAYELTTHRRHEWLLPRLRATGGEEPNRGTYGYSTHTASMVFWIATQTIGGDKILDVETSAVYAASLK
jgi:hypothetical protein